MPIHPFFDTPMFPWGRGDAQALHTALYQAINQPARITLFYQKSGGMKPLTPAAADALWGEVLINLQLARCLKNLCERLLADAALAAIHPAVMAVCNAKDIIPEIILPQDVVFLNRKALRSELEKLSRPGPCGVMLVRGPSGAGKSWTQQLISLVAEHQGANSVYMYGGTVSNVSETIENLFTALGDGGAVPPLMETEAAWYKKVCNRLQELAQKQKRVLWVVADDLGEYPDGPRVDRQIRDFFGQFVLSMANPAFALWFRVVLIDYPDGPVPTRWKSYLWCEDRPNESDVDISTIAEFLLKWAAYNGKQLGEDRADELAADILAKVERSHGNDVGRPRLERIYNELQGVRKKL